MRKRSKSGWHTRHSLPLGIDIDRWLAKVKTPWDAHSNADDGKMDAETDQALAASPAVNRRDRSDTGSRARGWRPCLTGLPATTEIRTVRTAKKEAFAQAL